jgi:hypothetical protein
VLFGTFTASYAFLADWADKDVAKEDGVDWANEWDDDEVETDFDKHLRAELAAAAAAAQSGKAVTAAS